LRALLALALASSLGCASCGPGGGPPASAELRVGVASSLRAAAADLASAYEEVAPAVTVVVSADSSAALRAQVEQGLAIDVLLAADADNPRVLADDGLTIGEPVVFAANTVALIVPADNPADVTGPADLARPDVRIVAAGEQVPITRYADEVVRRLGEQPDYPDGFAEKVAANTVSREDNVAAVRAKVALGEADAAFVYATDATGTDVGPVALPPAASVRAEYHGVALAGNGQPDAAAAFLAWVAGPGGQAILRAHGFLAP
jgi:molybdate transport system substrate-binding protein